MAEEHDFERWRDIRVIHKQNVDLYKRLGGFFVAGLLILFGVWIGRSYDEQDIKAFDLNLTTEFIGMVVTVGLFGLVSQWQADRRYKRQLIDDAASTSNETAKHAVHVMRRRGWLEGDDSLLRDADLFAADLREASLELANLQNRNLRFAKLAETNLAEAQLQYSDLYSANLQKAVLLNANLFSANLEQAELQNADLGNANLNKANLQHALLNEADLSGADLQSAKLGSTSFIKANLSGANLQGATMWGASLAGATLRQARLEGVNLNYVFFDTNTILPDGENWSPGTNLAQYVDIDSPEYAERQEFHRFLMSRLYSPPRD